MVTNQSTLRNLTCGRQPNFLLEGKKRKQESCPVLHFHSAGLSEEYGGLKHDCTKEIIRLKQIYSYNSRSGAAQVYGSYWPVVNQVLVPLVRMPCMWKQLRKTGLVMRMRVWWSGVEGFLCVHAQWVAGRGAEPFVFALGDLRATLFGNRQSEERDLKRKRMKTHRPCLHKSLDVTR